MVKYDWINQADVIEDLSKANSSSLDRYNFFGVDFTIKFDAPQTRDLYRRTYQHLAAARSAAEQHTPVVYHVISRALPTDGAVLVTVESKKQMPLSEIFTRGGNRYRFKLEALEGSHGSCHAVRDRFRSGQCVMIVNERACLILDAEFGSAYTELVIFNRILAQIPDHQVLHAGVVSWKDRGLILCGSTGSGKTTLTVGLVKQGCRFLSDEIAFIDRPTGDVMPFPRALGLRESAIGKFPQLGSVQRTTKTKSLSGDEKWLVDIEEVHANALGTRCGIDHVIFLSGFSQSAKLTPLPKSQALMESLKFSYASTDDVFQCVLNTADILKDVACHRLWLGDLEDSIRAIAPLVEN